MEARARDRDAQLYATSLDYTLKELQRRVREHETELIKLRSKQSSAPLPPSAQAKVIQSALEEVTESEPFLPSSNSVLPALIALRKTHQTIQESKEYLASKAPEADEDKRQLEVDQANLKDHRVLRDALKGRIRSLEVEVGNAEDRAPEDNARERLDELKNKKKTYDKETSKLMKAIRAFIQNDLAGMLAAEELGGPVVGEMMEVDSEELAAGFNAQGKPKRSGDGPNQDKRQRRIDEIWGQGASRAQEGDEITAAAAEMRALTEDLLNNLAASRGDASAAYVELPRESAAARFLVRSKVAQFHPRDARRLRLIDFGRDLAE